VIRFAVPAAALGTFLLTGCTPIQSDYSEYFQVVKQTFSASFNNHSISREQAAEIPYASIGYRLNDGPQLMLVLATDTNGQQLWTSSSHVVILTQDGRVTRTVGLPHDLGMLTPVRGPSFPSPATALEGPSLNYLVADFPDIGSYSVSIACRLAAKDRETIAILGQSLDTVRVDEVCQSTNWQFRNSYWLDTKTKFVWRSLNHISPKGDTLEIEVFRPPG
jgi:hypothetical protein